MIKASTTFVNGTVTVNLTGETEEDKTILQLAFNGREVCGIKPIDDGVALSLQKTEAKK